MPLSLGLGEVASIWVRQSRPDSKRKGVALPAGVDRVLSDVARGLAAHIHPSPRPVFAKFHKGSMDPPPQPLYSPLSPWVS